MINVLYLRNRFNFVRLKLLAGAVGTAEKNYLSSMSHPFLTWSHITESNNIQMNKNVLSESKWKMQFSMV